MGKIYGIDRSEDSVAASKKYVTQYITLGRVEFPHGSVSHLLLSNNMLDIVTAVETQFWWPNLPSDMREVFRVLKPGGTLIFICGNLKNTLANPYSSSRSSPCARMACREI
jgi:ubiquinone/menaquinone biosynthesis C-methylase UbiE